MPVERQPISSSQLGELIGIDPTRLIAIERDQAKDRVPQRWWIVLEPEDQQMAQPSGTFPQLTKGGKKKGGGKRGC